MPVMILCMVSSYWRVIARQIAGVAYHARRPWIVVRTSDQGFEVRPSAPSASADHFGTLAPVSRTSGLAITVSRKETPIMHLRTAIGLTLLTATTLCAMPSSDS